MSLFSNTDILTNITPKAADNQQSAQTIMQEFLNLHQQVERNNQSNYLDLHILHPKDPLRWTTQTAPHTAPPTLSIQYMRRATSAVQIERLMGRERVSNRLDVEINRHPVIELRLQPQQFIIELVVPPEAWWDQQNLVGKLSISRYKQTFYELLLEFSGAYRMGFWRGRDLSDEHLTSAQFRQPHIMEEWMSTFHPSKDWWRIGYWYDLSNPIHDAQLSAEKVSQHIRRLYTLYHYIAWSGENNYREFYSGR